ncbi:hypothetical protein OS493_015813 [Desmophyllum pertusum]|uniref:Uncharacterized protein n=1 Tax=Desmophyllum pertusum TaxID=174260 RepID=A0A9W9YFZ3_9CNID|nr:hypothetical protein OS493_015813 [Desmophyllum pertusum]
MRPRPPEAVLMLDPSQIHRPEEAYNEYNEFMVSRTNKSDKDFRNYDVNLQTNQVRLTYTLMHEIKPWILSSERRRNGAV